MKYTPVGELAAQIRRPPHGGRGLKSLGLAVEEQVVLSPSPRRAWIEIGTESAADGGSARRPPHGGRGLKLSVALPPPLIDFRRPPHGGRGLK